MIGWLQMVIYIVLGTGRNVWRCFLRIFLEGMRKISWRLGWHSHSVKFENAILGIRTNHSCHPIKSNLRVTIFISSGTAYISVDFLTLSLPKQYMFLARLLLRVRENSQHTRCWPQASSLSRYVILSNIGECLVACYIRLLPLLRPIFS